jgi:hypothetical protein
MGEVTPDPVFQVATGFMASKHLFVANELGVFPALADGPLELDELAARLGVPARSARITVDAMVALGFLGKEGGRYENAPVPDVPDRPDTCRPPPVSALHECNQLSASCALLAKVVHYFDEERNSELLRRVRGAVATGARLLLVDFWTDASHTQPPFAALMAGEFLVLQGGDVFSEAQAISWMTETARRHEETLALEGTPLAVVIGEAV